MARFNPPTPIVSTRTQRGRVEAKRKEHAESRGVKQAKRARRAQMAGDAFSQAHGLLERATGIPWRKARVRPERFWDERWDFSATRGRAAYEEIHEWMGELQQNRTVASYFSSRTLSILIVVEDGGPGGEQLTFTAAAAGDFFQAMDEMDDKLQSWAASYGRDSEPEDFSVVVEVVIFLRRRGVHPGWKQWVRGQATDREKQRRGAGR